MSEPWSETAPELLEVEAELAAREPIFHREEFGAVPGATRAELERMTTEDFWEVGALGQRYSREFVVGELEKRFATPHEDVWETPDFCCRQLAGNVFLLTYSLIQDETRLTGPTTVWVDTDDGWKIAYHQGTIVRAAGREPI